MNHDLNQLAKQFIEGEWLYNADDKVLKKMFASNKELSELNLVDEEGFLDSHLKMTITKLLGETILNHATGLFDDNDIFSGDILEDDILYNIELHKVSEVILDALQKIPNVTLKIVENGCL